MNTRVLPRVLIVGGDSMIGGSLATRLSRQGITVRSTSRRANDFGEGHVYLDLASIEDPEAIVADINCLILVAAVTGRAACQADPDGTRAINVDAPLRLAVSVLARGGHVVFLSTHAVLGGAGPYLPHDAPYDPPDIYTAQKAVAEQALRDLPGSGDLTIVRPTKVLGSKAGLIANWAAEIAAGRAIEVYSDLMMAPTGLDHVTSQISTAIAESYAGVLHISGAEEISYADFARNLGVRLAWPAELVREFQGRLINPIAASTPAHASLATNAPQTLQDLMEELTIQ